MPGSPPPSPTSPTRCGPRSPSGSTSCSTARPHHRGVGPAISRLLGSTCAALTALATFHGLRAGELRNMHLTDLADSRLRLGDRSNLLAAPVRVRLAAWLDHRTRRWPNTANPHVFLNHRNSNQITPIGARWLTLATGIPIHILREDRILHEARATGGDVRRICDLFGLTVEAALRYLPDLELSQLENESAPQPRVVGD